MFLCCIPRCRSPGPEKPCCGRLAQWWGRWASPHPRRSRRFKQKKARVQDRSASPLAQHSGLGIASSPDNCQPTKTDDLCVVGEWSNSPTAPKLLYRAFPWAHKPPEVPLRHTLLVKAQIEPRGSANAHFTARAVGPKDFACVSRDARSGPGLAPDLTAGVEQSPYIQTTPPLEQCWPSNGQRRHKDARGTAVSPGAEQGSGEALREEALGMEGLEPGLYAAAEAEDAAGAPDAALAPASAPAPQVPSAAAPVPHLAFPAPVVLYFFLFLPIVFLFYTLLSLYLNKF
nr:uncharacterized protein LOC103352224 [Oryctolagus cuniculus]